jgi:CcmD family protein
VSHPLFLSQVPSVAPSAATTPDERSTSFQPVQGGSELQSGERLLVEAYSVVWILLFGFLWLSWRRQRRIDQRIELLERALTEARHKAARGAG